MALTKYRLGDLIAESNNRNRNDIFSVDFVRGVASSGNFCETKANMSGVALSNYKIVKRNYFAYNPSRLNIGSIALSHEKVIVSPMYIVFHIVKTDLLLPEYLLMYMRRGEFLRYTSFCASGSVRDVFDFPSLCDVDVALPSLEVQQKYVDIYNAMTKNQESYEKGLIDLKTTCDAYIDILKHSKDGISIGNFITQIDNRNKSNNSYAFKGLSMNNYFIDSIANADGLDFSNYKIVAPNEYCAVLMKVGRDKRLTIARNDSDENYLVSPAYYTFKTSGINSDYFMVTVNRSEFERRGWFSCDTSARGSLPWGEFLNLVIPNADNNEQTIISKLYRALIERTNINNKLKEYIKDICPILIKGSLEEANK